jgi:hypothetical protein
MKKIVLGLVVAATALLVTQQDAQAGRRKMAERWGERFARTQPWHANYYYAYWGGEPVGLVVPPTANMQTTYGWGVSQTSMTPIYHQFRRPYPGPGLSGNGFRSTPRWPAHMDQFGVYYIRGPW